MTVKKVIYEGTQTVPIKIWTDQVEPQAEQQLRNIASMPFVHKHVAVMPDVHMGKGATVGSVIPTHRAIIPAAVGVDINCGMNAVRLSLKANDLPDGLNDVLIDVEAAIPLGAGGHHKEWKADRKLYDSMSERFDEIVAKHPKVQPKDKRKWVEQLGTLGSGNHFIELCLDENQDVWVMLHSGSRGVGNIIGSYFIERAREEMRVHFINLPDKDLAYLSEGTVLFDDYIQAVAWAQDYAFHNREVMMRLVLKVLARKLKTFTLTQEAINCHHNYVTKEHHFGENVWLTRKGAIRAREGDLGIIPGSMGTRSYIVRGKGSKDSFCSASHGAGRVMSRSEAKKLFTVEDLKKQTEGITCRKDVGVLDEIPEAYKDIDVTMSHQTDLVEVVHTLKQIVNVKG